MRITLLGTGDSAGIPVFGCQCPICFHARYHSDSQRQSAAAMIETPKIRIAIDANANFKKEFDLQPPKAVFLTHYHGDHVMGLMEARWGMLNNFDDSRQEKANHKKIPVYGPNDPDGFDDLYKHPGIFSFESNFLHPFNEFELADLKITTFPLNHSKMSLGYLFESSDGKSIAYCTDTCDLPDQVIVLLKEKQPDILIIDTTFVPGKANKLGHNDLDLSLKLIKRIQPKHQWNRCQR